MDPSEDLEALAVFVEQDTARCVVRIGAVVIGYGSVHWQLHSHDAVAMVKKVLMKGSRKGVVVSGNSGARSWHGGMMSSPTDP